MGALRFRRLLSLSLLAFAVACGRPEEGDSEAEASEGAVHGEVAFETVFPELAREGIEGTVEKRVDPRLLRLAQENNRYYLDVRFGALDEQRFERLRKFFGGHSQVPFAEGRRYALVDFLHPATQALVNHTYTTSLFGTRELREAGGPELEEDPMFLELSQNGISIMTNCYNTTAELLRYLHPVHRGSTLLLYFPDRFEADGWFSDDAFSTKVREADVEPGDALVVTQTDELSETSTIAHTALVVSKEVVFEKTDVSDDDPYRLALRKDVVAAYSGPGFSVGYRRFNGAGKQPLPEKALPTNEVSPAYMAAIARAHPALKPDNITVAQDVGFAGSTNPQPNEIQPVNVVVDPTTGRGMLEGERSVLARFVALKGE